VRVAVGIDPGLKGGIAALCSRRGILEIDRLPATLASIKGSARVVDARALRLMLANWSRKHDFEAATDVILVVERMATFGGPDEDEISRSSLLSVGHSAGLVEGVATAYSRRTIRALPQQWKGAFGLVLRTPKGAPRETTAQRKARSVKVAKMLYPAIGRAVHDIAEAVLIAHFGLGELTPEVSRVAQLRPAAPVPGDGDDPFPPLAA
jgi:hypothetical protein